MKKEKMMLKLECGHSQLSYSAYEVPEPAETWVNTKARCSTCRGEPLKKVTAAYQLRTLEINEEIY